MIPPSPLLVAIRTSLILVIALTIQLGMAPGLEVFGVQADLMLLVAICGGIAAGPDRGAAIGFAAGLTYALDGGMQKVAEKTFMLTPRNVEVSAEQTAQLVEKTFFNQS